MSQVTPWARPTRHILVLATALSALPLRGSDLPARVDPYDSPASISPAATQLEPFITTATRTPAAPQSLGTSVDTLSAAALASQQITTVSDALGSVAGAPLFASGARGAATSLFLRGANSNQTLFLVDGIRLNDPNTDYQVFLGGGALGAADRLEVARGPQSTLYGADAIGGVVALSAERGNGPAAGRISVEGGSFGTAEGTIASQGAKDANAWNFTASGTHTNNARPNNKFDAANFVLRLDHQVNETTAIGTTVRWFRSVFGSPGDRFTNDPNNEEYESNLLATAFAELEPSPAWSARVTLGGQDRRYVDDAPAPNPPYGAAGGKVIVTNRRGVLDAQASYTGLQRNRLTLGSTAESEETRNTGFGAIDQHQTQFAAFADDEYSPIDNVFLTGGVRADHFDTFGNATTGRATAAWLPLPHALKLRTSYGTGFRSPSFLDLYGRDPYFVGNPNLSPEHDRGFDAGFDYYLPEQRGTLSGTWFDSEFHDLIDYKFMPYPQPSTEQNLGRARARGVELSVKTTLPGQVEASASYAYLEALSLDAAGNAELLRRPRHQFSADVHRAFGAGLTAGAGVRYVGRRADVDAQTFATVVDGGYSVVRVYAAWQPTSRFAVKARLENALDRHYEPVNGYPALGFAAYGGIEYHF